MLHIKIWDSLMGSGKTTMAIKEIEQSPELRRIFLVKYLDEAERIIRACPRARFYQPDASKYGSKQAHFHELLRDGKNIVTTHQLFKDLSITKNEHKLISEYGYKLYMDETAEVIEPLNISSHDRKEIMERYIETGNDRLVKWIDTDYTGNHDSIKRQVENKAIYLYRDKTFLWLFPIELLTSFREITVMTFLFEGSHMRAYLDLYGLSYEYWHIQDHKLVKGKQDLRPEMPRIRSLIDIYDGNLNDIGDHKNALSSTWHKNNKQKVRTLELNARNYLEKKCDAKVEEAQWTTFKSAQRRMDKSPAICGKYFVSSYVPLNAVSTNDHDKRKHLAYLVNVFENPSITMWFHNQGIILNEDAYALSQMLQWILRSAIRRGESISIYVPSRRMRQLLIDFLEQKLLDIPPRVADNAGPGEKPFPQTPKKVS